MTKKKKKKELEIEQVRGKYFHESLTVKNIQNFFLFGIDGPSNSHKISTWAWIDFVFICNFQKLGSFGCWMSYNLDMNFLTNLKCNLKIDT